MPVYAVDEFEGHNGSPVYGVHIATGGTKATVTSERDKLKIPAFGAAVHGTSEGRVATVYHLIHVVDNGITWMSEIYELFIMIFEDILKNVSHMIIMKDMRPKENLPLKIEGQGS